MDFLENLTPEAISASIPIMGLVVWAIVEYLVKRNISDENPQKYSLIVNVSSAVVGILIAFLVTFIALGITPRTAAWALIQGLLAGAVATIGHEFAKNIKSYRDNRQG